MMAWFLGVPVWGVFEGTATRFALETGFDFPHPMGAWFAVWERGGLEMPDNGL